MARQLTHEPFKGFNEADFEVDIAVVGGGVAGVYTALRLKQSFPEKRIAVFEYSNRTGGRLYTITLPGMPDVHAEVGGMRFIPETQPFVRELVAKLNLTPRDFPMGASNDPSGTNNLLYLRRRLLRASDLKDPTKIPYQMDITEQGMTPDELQKYVMDSLVPNASQLTQDEWNRMRVFNGEELYKLGFWNVLYKALSSEAYQYMYDAGGYYTNVANTNAVLALPVADYGANVVYKTLEEGYDSIPLRLERLYRDLHGEYRYNHRLDSMTRMADQRYALLFVRTQTDERGRTSDIEVDGDKQTARVFAKKVVLALPRRALELIRWDPFAFDSTVRDLLSSVISQAAFKLFLAYPYPWWRPLGLWAGRSITDMPLRQSFYFGTQCERKGNLKNTNSLMMVSYNDLGSVPFWKALEEGDEFRGRPNPFVPDHDALVKKHRFTVTEQMVQAAQQQLRELHGLRFIPEPYSAVYHDWSDDPYGGGWHAWKAGMKFWELMPRVRKPVENEDVFICGEAYSLAQGWVEGALQTAELMLEEHFDLKRPDWLPSTYNLGY